MGDKKKIFVLCGAGAVSGGAELVHQFCNEINQHPNGLAKICYVDLSGTKDGRLPVDVDAPERYRVYGIDHARDMQEVDNDESMVVVPEGLTLAIPMFQKASIIVWWMSVDNYFKASGGSDKEYIRKRASMHFVQSFYAKKFTEKEFPNTPILWMTDYIRQEHGAFLYPAEYRQDIVLYNPAKGYETTKRVMEQINWIQWIPISGRSVEEVVVLMQMAKIYVDFGNHPGRDRIPREAAANGCCVITNREGSAAYREDVPIADCYKFEQPDKQIEEIDRLLHKICTDFSRYQADFSEYRNWIKEERKRFAQEVKFFIDLSDDNGSID